MVSVNETIDVLANMSWRRAFAIIITSIAALLVLTLYETYTHHFRLSRAASAIALGVQAEQFRASLGASPQQKQLETYYAAIEAANSAATDSGSIPNVADRQLKFLFGFLPWAFMALVFLGGDKNDRLIGTFGATIIGLLVAAALSFVPTVAWPVGSLVIVPVVVWFIVVALFNLRRKPKRGA